MATDLRSPPDAGVGAPSGIERVRISRKMFGAMIEAGVIREGQRIQLIDGELFRMPAMNDPHWTVLNHLINLFPTILPKGWAITGQSPVIVDEFGEPEPDIAIIRGTPAGRKAKPTAADAVVVIEVSDTTIGFDRRKKLRAYAESGIPEYWILNIAERVAEVRTVPRPRAGETHANYAELRTYLGDEKVPLRLDGQTIAEFPVTELIPL